MSYRWLDENYQRRYGLRDWTWRKIIEGIILEHKRQIEADGPKSKMDPKYVSLIWHNILKLANIKNLDEMP